MEIITQQTQEAPIVTPKRNNVGNIIYITDKYNICPFCEHKQKSKMNSNYIYVNCSSCHRNYKVGFENGGIPALINGIRAQQGAIIGGNSIQGDKIPVRINSREAVMTLQDQQEMFKLLREEKNGEKRNQPLTINLQVGEKQLSKVLLNLTEKGFRLAS